MVLFTKESLEKLRQKIDLVYVLSSYVCFSQSEGLFKAKCPFHEEKTQSFIADKKNNHYHCYECGADGDAVTFLMDHQKMGFIEAVEHLSKMFESPLDVVKKRKT